MEPKRKSGRSTTSTWTLAAPPTPKPKTASLPAAGDEGKLLSKAHPDVDFSAVGDARQRKAW